MWRCWRRENHARESRMSCWSRAGRPADTALFLLRHEQFLVPRLLRLISLPFPRIWLRGVPGPVQRALPRRPSECPKALISYTWPSRATWRQPCSPPKDSRRRPSWAAGFRLRSPREELGMLLSANPVDEADIFTKIRSKLADSWIQESYRLDSQVFRRRGDGKPCRGCDQPILRTDRTSLGYVSALGERHWFHLLCDTVRQFVAANELKRAPRRGRRGNDTERLLVLVRAASHRRRGPGMRPQKSSEGNTEHPDGDRATAARRAGTA
jgi:hypothetical protein